MKGPLAALIGAATLIGCTTHWQRVGAADEDLQRDASACRAQAVAASPPDGSLGSYATMRAIEESCMKGKGWTAK